MKHFVVDTNVPIVANGRPDPSRGGKAVTVTCRLAAIDFLEQLLLNGRLLIDVAGEIQGEYRAHLNPRGQPGVGDRFYLAVLQSAPQRITRVSLPKRPSGDFADFPNDPTLASFDRSDRKFAALARRARAPVAVTTDSDWANHKAPLIANGIKLRFLCGENPAGWYQS